LSTTPKKTVSDALSSHTTLDLSRSERTGLDEIVFGQGKSVEQLVQIIQALYNHNGFAFATRVDAEKAGLVLEQIPSATYYKSANILSLGSPPPKTIASSGDLLVLCAGTSDSTVAQESAITAELIGLPVTRIFDVGVAGLHRLLAHTDALNAARVVVVVAGMEGALASVVAGLTAAPVIAVPTSVGYGAHFEGLTALLAMINSCAAGVSVVNIDNGFGAAIMAHRILRGQQS
jgi:NCAIR mutase (PurE)-related protein